MKNRIIVFILVMFALTANCHIIIASHTPFKYPFSQGDSKWNEFSSPQDRVAALQIPNNSLAFLSTEDLLLISLDYPYLLDVFAFDDMDTGIKAVASKFNGFHEFLSRKDQTEAIEKVFKRLSSDNLYLNSSSDLEIGHNSMRISILSYLLGRPEILDKLTSYRKENLLNITQKTLEKVSHNTSYNPSLGYSALQTLEKLLSAFPNRQIVGDYMSVTRYTPNGSSVLAWKLFQNELTASEKSAYASYVTNNYGATVISEATKTYNCHAYAWHMAEGGDSVWIGLNSITDENVYWDDNSYIEVAESFATKVSYYESANANHSAIRITNNLYRSKWGKLPLVEHEPNVCPYDTSMPKKFYIRKPIISGSYLVCSTESYTIQNLPSNATVQWSLSNSRLSLVSGQGTGTATFQKVSNGACTISAQILIGTTTITTITKDVWAGTPTQPSISGWPSNNQFLPRTSYQFDATGDSEAQILEYQWCVVSGATITSGGNTNSATFKMNNSGSVKIGVRARNACGWGPYKYKMGMIQNDAPINSPGNNTVSIPLSDDGEYEIQLWNTNRMIRSAKTTKSSYDVDLNNLPSDLYIIKVLKDGRSVSQLKVRK